MSDKKVVRYFITGRVQGVWFRAATQDKANELGLTGWARNLPDGRVEVLACGVEENLQELFQWLHEGPELAKVTEVTYDEMPWEEHERFAVK